MSILFKLIYNPQINSILLSLLKFSKKIIPNSLKLNPTGIITLKSISPNFEIRLFTNQTSHITSQLYWDGIMNYEYTPVFLSLVKKINVFLDIGANIGFYSITAKTINPNIDIHSIEPSESVMNVLRKNIELNGFKNLIKTYKIALSDKEEKLILNEVYNPKYPNIANLSGEHNVGTKDLKFTKKVEVRALPLDIYYKENNINQLDLIKIDTEGYEAVILENANFLIQEFKPIIICETLFNKIETQLNTIMLEHGYEFYNHVEGTKLKKVSTIIRSEDDGIRNCFFVHPSKKHLIEEYIID